MKKFFSGLLAISALILSGCSLFPQDAANTTPELTQNTPEETSREKTYRFTYNSGENILTAEVPELQLVVMFDYPFYQEVCGGTWNYCITTWHLPPEYFETITLSVKDNVIYDGLFTIHKKDPGEEISQAIYNKFSIFSSSCPLIATEVDSTSRITKASSVMYTPNYELFVNAEKMILPDILNERCKNLGLKEVYYSPEHPDRFLVENLQVQQREDDLFGFLRVRYTE